MKILRWVLFFAGVALCVFSALGHNQAWSAAAVCFFASVIISVKTKNNGQ